MSSTGDERAKRHQRWRRRTHLALTVLFAIQIPIALATSLKNSVPYLVSLSLYALVASHWSAFEAAHPPIEED